MHGIFDLNDRAVLSVSGLDRTDFLERLITNTVKDMAPDEARYAALLTPQGKYLFDFLVLDRGEYFLLDVDRTQADHLIQRLTMYKLRADVVLEKTRLEVAAILGEDVTVEGVVVDDPRHAKLGRRLYGEEIATEHDLAAYHAYRICLGLPHLPVDAEAEKTLSLEANLDMLNGVDFTKGCYVGQELTARMKHRGKVRKQMVSVRVTDGAPGTGTPILTSEGKEAGQIRSTAGQCAIALLRLEDVDKGPLTADGRQVEVLH